MVKINSIPDCNNAPKKAFIRDFETAFAQKNLEIIVNSLDENVYWEMVGEKVIQGKENAQILMLSMLDSSM